MTIEEYFDNEIEKAEMENYDVFNSTEFAYHHLTIKLLKMLKEEILKVDFDVTLRELHEMCKKHDYNCTMNGETCVLRDSSRCILNDFSPNYWPIDEIQKRIKEMKNDD